MVTETPRPGCFGYALSSNDWLKEQGIEKGDCKKCGLLEDCIKEYNERTYNEWCDDELELENPDDDWALEDDDAWEPEINYIEYPGDSEEDPRYCPSTSS